MNFILKWFILSNLIIIIRKIMNTVENYNFKRMMIIIDCFHLTSNARIVNMFKFSSIETVYFGISKIYFNTFSCNLK